MAHKTPSPAPRSRGMLPETEYIPQPALSSSAARGASKALRSGTVPTPPTATSDGLMPASAQALLDASVAPSTSSQRHAARASFVGRSLHVHTEQGKSAQIVILPHANNESYELLRAGIMRGTPAFDALCRIPDIADKAVITLPLNDAAALLRALQETWDLKMMELSANPVPHTGGKAPSSASSPGQSASRKRPRVAASPLTAETAEKSSPMHAASAHLLSAPAQMYALRKSIGPGFGTWQRLGGKCPPKNSLADGSRYYELGANGFAFVGLRRTPDTTAATSPQLDSHGILEAVVVRVARGHRLKDGTEVHKPGIRSVTSPLKQESNKRLNRSDSMWNTSAAATAMTAAATVAPTAPSPASVPRRPAQAHVGPYGTRHAAKLAEHVTGPLLADLPSALPPTYALRAESHAPTVPAPSASMQSISLDLAGASTPTGHLWLLLGPQQAWLTSKGLFIPADVLAHLPFQSAQPTDLFLPSACANVSTDAVPASSPFAAAAPMAVDRSSTSPAGCDLSVHLASQPHSGAPSQESDTLSARSDVGETESRAHARKRRRSVTSTTSAAQLDGLLECAAGPEFSTDAAAAKSRNAERFAFGSRDAGARLGLHFHYGAQLSVLEGHESRAHESVPEAAAAEVDAELHNVCDSLLQGDSRFSAVIAALVQSPS